MLNRRNLLKSVLLPLSGVFLFITFAVAMNPKTGKSLKKRKTILLIDDYDILYYSGLKRKIRPLTRSVMNPVISSGDKPWERYLAYNSVYKNPVTGLYQMWYQSYFGSETPDKSLRCIVCYAESQDGIRWNKPDLDIFPFYDIKQTNIVLLSNKGHSTHYGASVIVTPDDPDSNRRYKMAYWDFVPKGKEEAKGLCIAFSPDGIHWKKYSDNPVLDGAYGNREQPPFVEDILKVKGKKESRISSAISDVIDASYDSLRQKYVIYSKTWIDGPDGRMFWKRAVARTESDDFIHWSQPQLMLWPDEFDAAQSLSNLMSPNRQNIPKDMREQAKGVQLHSGPAFYYNGIYFSLLQVLDLNITGLMPVELAISRDGLNWNRPFRGNYFIPVDGEDRFDSGTIWSNSTPVFQKDEIRFYYGAYIDWYIDDPKYNENRLSGIGLATMPRDRFAGMEPIERFGMVTLKPIELGNCRGMTINADATSGAVRVELLDQNGYRLKGFGKEDSNSVSGDSISHKIHWKNKSWSDLQDGKYLIRIYIENAVMYAVTFHFD